jgi:hypothetical protein
VAVGIRALVVVVAFAVGCGRVGFSDGDAGTDAATDGDAVIPEGDGGPMDGAPGDAGTTDSGAPAACELVAGVTTIDAAGASIIQPDAVARTDGWALSYQRREETGGEYAYVQLYQRFDTTLAPQGSPLELSSFVTALVQDPETSITSDGTNELVAFESRVAAGDLRFALVDAAGALSQEAVLISDVSAGTSDVATNSRGHLVSFDDAVGLSAFPVSLFGTSSGDGTTAAPGGIRHRIAPTESGFAVVHESVRNELRIHPVDDSGASAGTTTPIVGPVNSFDVTTSPEGQIMIAALTGSGTLRLIRLDGGTLETISSQSPPQGREASWLRVAAMGERFAVLTFETSTGLLLEVFTTSDDEGLGPVPVEGVDSAGVSLAGSLTQTLVVGASTETAGALRLLSLECR